MSLGISCRVGTSLKMGVPFFLLAMPVLATSLGTRDANLEREVLYIQRLQQAGLHDYADLVIDEARQRYPAIEARVKVLELEGLLARGKFEEARSRIAREDDPHSASTWAMKLALGDSYYAFGRYEEADEVYRSFFDRYPDGPPEELNTFYRDAAYAYAQMLLYTDREREALDAYRLVLKADLDPNEQRQMHAEMGELMLKLAQRHEGNERKALLREARKLADDLLWIQDVWFGKGIVLLAHLQMLQGNIARAQDLVEEYMPQLRSIDQSIREQAQEVGQDLSRISPMAECRYLLGVLLQEEAQRLMESQPVDREKVLALLIGEKTNDGKRRPSGALHHFVNVFIRYPDTHWAAESGERADTIETLLEEEFGAKIRKSITPEQWARVRRNLFREARLLFSRNRFAEAAEQYIDVINRFPRAGETVPALGELARAYIEEKELLLAETVAGHLAERYAGVPELQKSAGDEVLRLARLLETRGLHPESQRVYEKFFANHANHPMAPATFFRFGEENFDAGNTREALPYYQKIAQSYSNSPLRYSSMSRIATLYERENAVTNEIAALDTYVEALRKRERPGQELISAQFRLAQAMRKDAVQQLRSGSDAAEQDANQKLRRAAARYHEIVKMLEESDDSYQENAKDREANRQILEAARFSIAQCLMMLTLPADRQGSFKRAAIESFENLVREAPDSKFSARALSRVATLWTVLESPERAQDALERLRENYPDSPEARNALFMMGRTLLEIGLQGEATAAFRQMFREGGDYAASQLNSAGDELLAANELDLARQAFESALGKAQNSAEQATALLGKARVQIESEEFSAAVETLDTFLREIPDTRLTLEALMLQSQAATAAAQREPSKEERSALFRKAEESMRKVRSYREKPTELFEIDLEVARILAARARAEERFGETNNRERVRDLFGMAIAAYLQITLNADPSDVSLSDVLQNAYYESIPLMIELNDWENVQLDCQSYLENFPRGRYHVEMRTWMNQARVESGTDDR